MAVSQSTACGSCKNVLEESPNIAVAQRQPCPNCGSLQRAFSVEINESIRALDSLRMKQKRQGIKGYLADMFEGWERRRSVGDYVKKSRVIDRETNRYFEHVETETGEILKHQDEPLSDHVGHGSDKSRSS